MIIFVAVFGNIAKLPSEGIPYPVLVAAALLPWQFFANALSESSSSLLSNANLITKVYFPRVILPASSIIVALVDFAITIGLLAVVMIWYHFLPSWRILTLPIFTFLALLAALGPGLLITALTVKYRDFRYVVPFVVQFGYLVSPVAYSSTVIDQHFGQFARLLYSLNPIVGVIDGFRWAVGGDASLHPIAFPLSIFISLSLLWYGVRYFRHTEKSFADVI